MKQTMRCGCFLSEIDALLSARKYQAGAWRRRLVWRNWRRPCSFLCSSIRRRHPHRRRRALDSWLTSGNKSVSSIFSPLSSNYSDHPVFQTLVHQIGHSLGLSHSNVYDSVMFPFMKIFNASSPLNFHREDIKAIQTLYGEKTGGVDLSIAQEAASEKQNPSSLFCNDHPQQEPEGKGTYVQTPPSTQSSELLMGTPMSSRGKRWQIFVIPNNLCLSVLAAYQPRVSWRWGLPKNDNSGLGPSRWYWCGILVLRRYILFQGNFKFDMSVNL